MAKKKIDIRKTLPKKVKIGGAGYKLKLPRKVYVNDVSVMGAYHHQSKTIEVSKDLHDPSNIHSTFLHELFHAVLDATGVNLIVSDDLEEIIVENCANATCENFILIPRDQLPK